MTYRERRLARAERLREWAEKREARATADLTSNPELRHDWAFITQPGHIPERARMNARDDRAFRSLDKAARMSSRAASIEAAADRAIYSDDPDAIERLEERIAALEAERDARKAANAEYRKTHRPEPLIDLTQRLPNGGGLPIAQRRAVPWGAYQPGFVARDDFPR